MSTSFALTVTYDDGTADKVTAGQREMARWEAEPFGCASLTAMDAKPITFMRYLAWAALSRKPGATLPAFAKWSEGVDEVSDAEADAAATDPTSPGRPDGA